MKQHLITAMFLVLIVVGEATSGIPDGLVCKVVSGWQLNRITWAENITS